MHEKIEWHLLECALSGKEPLLTPIERDEYESYRRDIAQNPGMQWDIPTDYPELGIKMRYSGADGEGLTADFVAELERKSRKVIDLLQKHGMVCEDGRLTVSFDSKAENTMEMKADRCGYRLILPAFGCALEGRLEEQLSYGISAYTMRNFNSEEEYVLKTLEEIACRVVSIYLLRKMGLNEKADEVQAGGGTEFISECEGNSWEPAGDTKEDIRNISALFKRSDLIPFLRLRDYVVPCTTLTQRTLDMRALHYNYPKSKAVRALCDVWKRIEKQTDDFADYMMGDPEW